MRLSTKLLSAAAIAGFIAAGSSAFTAAGITLAGSGSAAPTQLIGGQTSQTVTGTTVDSVLYSFASGDTTRSHIQKVSLTFGTAIPENAVLTVTGSEVTAHGDAAVTDSTVTFHCGSITNGGTAVTCDVWDVENQVVEGTIDYITYNTSGTTVLSITVADGYYQGAP